MPHKDFFAQAVRRMAVSGLRQNNERAVLNALALHPGASAANLARVTGLGPQSISRILVALEGEHLIQRGEPLRGQRGQPAIPIHLNPTGAYSLGCEIGWRHLAVVLCDFSGQRLGEYRRDYPYPDPASIIDEVASIVRLMTNLVPEDERNRIVSLGVAMPSGLSRNLRLLGADPAVAAAWDDIVVEAELQSATGFAVHVMNDGNAGCWAELVLHLQPRPNDFAYIFLGTFIGGGLVAQGRLWEGATRHSGNLGSILVSDGKGSRKPGHLVASLYSLEQRLLEEGITTPKQNPGNWNWGELGPAAEHWLMDAAQAIAEIIANTSAVSDLDLAIVDGALPDDIINRLVGLTAERLNGLSSLTNDPPRVARGQLGNSAAAVGAAFRPLYRQYFARGPEHQPLAVA